MKQTLKIFALVAIAVAFAAMPVAAKKDKGARPASNSLKTAMTSA